MRLSDIILNATGTIGKDNTVENVARDIVVTSLRNPGADYVCDAVHDEAEINEACIKAKANGVNVVLRGRFYIEGVLNTQGVDLLLVDGSTAQIGPRGT